MKSILIRWAFMIPSLLLVGALFYSASAHSQTLTAQIQTLELDPSLGLPGDLRTGLVTVQKETQELIVRLSRGTHCPTNALCRDLNPEDIEIKLPLIEMFQTGCGSKIYKASLMNAEGAKQELTVIDNSRLKCTILRPQTEVILKTSSTIPALQTESYMDAVQLN